MELTYKTPAFICGFCGFDFFAPKMPAATHPQRGPICTRCARRLNLI